MIFQNINTPPNTTYIFALLIISSILSLNSCSPEAEYVPIDQQVGALPQFVIAPNDNPTTAEKVELGRKLFWDPVLSGNFDMACVTCHHPNNGYTDNIDLSLGVGGRGLAQNRTGGILIKRNAPTIINTAFNGIDQAGNYDPSNTVHFWDNRSKSLEDQSLEPIKSMEEMRGDAYTADEAINVVSARLAAIPQYVELFNIAFGDDTQINGDKIGKAIAAFERTIIANNSRFDQYARGDETALNAQEIRGLNAFIEAKCTACHNGPMFSDYKLHDLGVPNNDKLPQIDNGVDGKFRTPTLRNLSSSGPFMHNGVFDNLTSAVNFYDNMEVNDDDAAQLNFEDEADTVAAIVAFIQTLNDEDFDKTIPESVPSGLPVGGNISN